MKYNPAIHKRKSIRLQGYDYSQAALYFITICVQNRELLFGEIENGEMILNDAGKMIQTEWEKLRQRFNNIELHEFKVMPNHFHGILEIVGATLVVAQNGMGGKNDMGSDNVNAGHPQGATTRVAPTDNQNNMVDKNVNGQHPQGATTRVAPTGTKNDMVDQNDIKPVGATLVVAPDHVVAPDTMAAPNELVAAPNNKTIGDMIAAFKSITTVEYINGVKNSGWQPFNRKLWHRNYYEHIIRDERAYQNIADYIINNPARWQDDQFYRI